MEFTEADLGQATDVQLASMLLHQLYILYDAGGISNDRSIKSGLLERARSLFQESCYFHDSSAALLEEVDRREQEPRQLYLFTRPSGITKMLDFELAVVMLNALKHLIEHNPSVPRFEVMLLLKALSLLPQLTDSIHYGNFLLIAEANRRRWLKNKMSYEYMQSMGYGHLPPFQYPQQG